MSKNTLKIEQLTGDKGLIKRLSSKELTLDNLSYTSKTKSIIDKFIDFETIQLKNENIFEKYGATYLSEINSSHLYEVMTGVLSSEINFPKYDIIHLDKIISILKDCGFKRVNSWAKCQVEKYSDYDLSGLGDTYVSNSLFLLFSEKEKSSIKIEIDESSIDMSMSSEDLLKISDFLKKFETLEVRETNNQIGIIHDSGGGLSIKKIKIDKVEVNISDNYGASFVPVHNSIVTKLKEKKTGLFFE